MSPDVATDGDLRAEEMPGWSWEQVGRLLHDVAPGAVLPEQALEEHAQLLLTRRGNSRQSVCE